MKGVGEREKRLKDEHVSSSAHQSVENVLKRISVDLMQKGGREKG